VHKAIELSHGNRGTIFAALFDALGSPAGPIVVADLFADDDVRSFQE
jgi:hypothetical protein